jgi:tetratricopeptide (TPR) repeat protein
VAANLHLKEGRPDEGIQLLRKVTKLHPNNALAWNNLAATLASQWGQTQTALDCINRAIDVAGQNIPTLLDTKAMILLELGKPQEALGLLEEAIKSPNGSDPRFYLHLSMAYEHTGAIADARNALEKSHSLGLSEAYLTSLEKTRLSNLTQRLAQQGS